MKQVIQIRCKNNKKTQKVEIGSTLFDVFSAFDLKMTHGPVSARVNNKVEGMHYRVYNSKDVEFLDMNFCVRFACLYPDAFLCALQGGAGYLSEYGCGH